MKTYHITFNPNVCFGAYVKAETAQKAVKAAYLQFMGSPQENVISLDTEDERETEFFVYEEGNHTGEPNEIIVY